MKMKKKELSFFLVVVISICMVYFAFFRIGPPISEIQATGQACPCPSETSGQAVLFVPVGVVCAFFAVLAVSPLLAEGAVPLGERVRWEER